MIHFSDKEWIEHLIKNDSETIISFFYKKNKKIFAYHLYKIFPYQIDVKEYITEFFLYLQANDWKRLKTFQFEYSLTTWISVVSYRFFKNYKTSMIDSRGVVTITDKWDSQTDTWMAENNFEIKRDTNMAIAEIKNERDREIAKMLFLEEFSFEEVGQKFDLATDYVYTIKNRISKMLREKLKAYKS